MLCRAGGSDGQEAVRLDWLLLAGLVIMWVAFLAPAERRRPSASTSVGDFERRMELLAQAETYGEPGRWIVTPRKGVRFLGHAQRERARSRERRKRVFIFLLEAIGLTFLIGFAPPLHAAWTATFGLIVLLFAYIWVLLALKHRAPVRTHDRVAASRAPERARVGYQAVSPRWVSSGRSSPVRQTFSGLGAIGEGDGVHVVVRRAAEIGAAGV